MTSRSRGSRLMLALVLTAGTALVAAGCRQDMHDAPRYDPLEASAFLPAMASAQPLVEGTIPRGGLRQDPWLYTGRVDGQDVTAFPFAITAADLDRGEERFNIYCSPCHSRVGDGTGMVVQRGYRQPPSYHIDRLRTAPVGYLYAVITNGFGTMPAYAAQVPVTDRWRIVAYIRALQLSQHATEADVPADEMERIRAGLPAPSASETAAETEH